MLTNKDLQKIAAIVADSQNKAKEQMKAVEKRGLKKTRRRVIMVTLVVVALCLTDRYVQHHEALTKTSELTVSALMEWFFTRARENV